MTYWDRNEKRIGKEAIQSLNQSRVGIVGLGSLGSQIAVQLAMSGIGTFVLIDPDRLEEHNIVRHAADLRAVGEYKVEAVADLIRFRNTAAQIRTHTVDVLTDIMLLNDVDLVIIAGLGSEIAQSQLARKLRELGKPTLVGGLYERAIAGEILFVEPTSGPCYSCFASFLREAQQDPMGKPVEYGLAPDEVKAQPGLGVDVARVASIVAKWALSLLISNSEIFTPYPGNLLIIANDAYQLGEVNGRPLMLPPFNSRWFTIPKLADCLICGLTESSVNRSIDELLKR